MSNGRHLQSGLGTIAVIMVLVILAALAAAITTLSSGQHQASAQDIQSARAWQGAQAGTEWGLAQALKSASCDAAVPVTWNHPDYSGMKVTVACDFRDYSDGESVPGTSRVVRVFQVTATACNGVAASCPDNTSVASPGYVERQRLAVAYCEWTGGACVGP